MYKKYIYSSCSTMADVVQIATLKGSLVEPWDLAVRLFSLLNDGVHTEIWWGGYRFLASTRVCVMRLPVPSFSSDWHVVDVHVSDIDLALGFIDAALGARYGIDLAECALQYRTSDLDSCCPATWDGGVFCSQFVLLFLRWCDVHGLLAVDGRLLWSVNSRGCLPSRLEIILHKVFGPHRRVVQG